MVVFVKPASRNTLSGKFGIVFRYTRANIYSYHALIGALELNADLKDIPIFIPRPQEFFMEIERLLTVKGFSKLLVGFSINTFQMAEYRELFRKLKMVNYRQQMVLVAGGPHPSARPQELLELGADFVVIGEGEKTFPEIVRALVNRQDVSKLKGIAFLNEDHKLVIAPKNDLISLDDYPPFAPEHGLFSALEIMRGCRYHCTYCQVPTLIGRPIRFRSPETIIKWGKFLLKQRENWDFRFITPNAFGYGAKRASEPNYRLIEDLLAGLQALQAKKRRRIFFGTFPSEVRPESVTDETLRLTREYCDNDNLTVGAQSGSPRILKAIRRGHTVEAVETAVDLANSYGFQMNVDFIIGFPEETAEDQELTIALCKRLLRKNCKIHMHYLIPLPGTIYERQKARAIEPDILKLLRKWSNEGIIFGSWQHQYEKVQKEF